MNKKDLTAIIAAGRRRVVVEGVKPEVDCGRYAVKRVVGEKMTVEADIFTDGHDKVMGMLLYRKENVRTWQTVYMTPLVNDRWRGSFTVTEKGRYVYTLVGWVDTFGTWRFDLEKRYAAGQDLEVALSIGAQMIEQVARRVRRTDVKPLATWAKRLAQGDVEERYHLARDEALYALMLCYPQTELATRYARELPVVVDRVRARFSTWYELFPRSCGDGMTHGTLHDCEARLAYIAEMGFDVLYLPPIFPIGESFRKGKNNVVTAGPGDVGSPWAIGAPAGGHDAIHPQLGTLEDFRRLLAKAREQGLEIALDMAFQCSPDHPYVKAHLEWFRMRPDGTIQYAENPPKKYQDIYPFDFESKDYKALWEELYRVVRFWIEQGVSIFRVDNPHTKPFVFWEWLIQSVKLDYPDVLFLAEAFTRPKVMHNLAKLGFTHSYTYFTWRTGKQELTEYFTELGIEEGREYFRPNVWPNTPDILHEYLQTGGRPAFMIRLILAATLAANYGIYGPAFELHENRPVREGSEEYLDSEKYQIRAWDLDRSDSLKALITRLNHIRRDNPALQGDWGLEFHRIDHEQLIAYSKRTEDLANIIVVVVNLDPYNTHYGWVNLALQDFGIDPSLPYQMEDLLTGARYLWQGEWNYVELNPYTHPAHIFKVRSQRRTEQDFEYFV